MISVCMSTYNGEKFIYKQLESILNQTLKPDEVVICDDCSGDGTVNIIKQFIAKNHLTDAWRLYENTENKGYPGNFYYTMQLCRGDVVFLADQDDLWATNKIQDMCAVLEKNPEIELLASKWGIVDENDTILKKISRGQLGLEEQRDSISVSDVLYCYDWPGMSMCYRKEFGEDVVERAVGSNLAHDVAMSLMAAERGSFQCVHKVMQYHRRHGANAALEEHRIRKNLNKKRKMLEIERYIAQLNDILSVNVLCREEHMAMVCRKKDIMFERFENLKNKNRKGILAQYRKNKKDIRLATVICDWLICGQKC